MFTLVHGLSLFWPPDTWLFGSHSSQSAKFRTFKSTKPAAVLCATGWLEPIRSTVRFVCNGLQSDRDLEHKKLSANLHQTKHSKPSKQTGQKQWNQNININKPIRVGHSNRCNSTHKREKTVAHVQAGFPSKMQRKKHQIKMIALIRGGHWQLTFQHCRAGMKHRIVIFSRLTIYIYIYGFAMHLQKLTVFDPFCSNWLDITIIYVELAVCEPQT